MATTNPTPAPGSLPPSIHISFKLVAIVAAAVLVLLGGARYFLMHTVHVDLGEEAVFIDKPYFWGKAGVRDTPLKVGRKTEFNSTSEIKLIVAPRAYAVVLKDMPSKGLQLVNVDAVVTLRVTNSPDLIDKFGIQWFDNAFLPRYPSIVRDVIGKRTVADLVGDSDTLKQVEISIGDDIRTMLMDEGIALELIDFSIKHVEAGSIPQISKVKLISR